MPAGRPTDYSIEKAAEICVRLADGQSLRAICRKDDMPCLATVYVWLAKHPEFVEQYTRAKEDQGDTYADEIVDIADNVDEDANSRRVRVDARKWVAAKLKPKRYGDKVDLAHSGVVRMGVEWLKPEQPAS